MKRILPILLLLLIIAPVAALNDDAWPEAMHDWDHRVPITITNAPGAGVQRMINVTFQEGMQADFDDLRPYTSAGSAIDYWIETYTASSYAHVWVELPSAAMTYVYVYYDNAEATDASDGDAVFEEFIDSTTGWQGDTSILSMDGDLIKVYENSGTLAYSTYYPVSVSRDIVVETTVQMYNLHVSRDLLALLLCDGSDSHRFAQVFAHEQFGGHGYYAGSNYKLLPFDYDVHRWKINARFSSSKMDIYIDDVGATDVTYAYGSPTEMDRLYLVTSDQGYTNAQMTPILIYAYDAAATTFTVGTPEKPSADDVIPFPGFEDTPTDPDGDGLYEDCNGNGRIDFNDLLVLFQNTAWAQANQPTISYFDWSGNGKIEFSDVVAFWESDY